MEAVDKHFSQQGRSQRADYFEPRRFLSPGRIGLFDLKGYLFYGADPERKGLPEAALRGCDWQQYEGKNLAVFCSADAIIPVWAYMLVAAYAAPFAKNIFQGADEFYKMVTSMHLME
ncbi:MAG: DUF2480 family protein [Saprospiraceae bacterium]